MDSRPAKGALSAKGSKLVNKISWIGLGHKDFALSLAADPLRGGIWLGFIYQGGISISPTAAFKRYTQPRTDWPTAVLAIYKLRETARFGRQPMVA